MLAAGRTVNFQIFAPAHTNDAAGHHQNRTEARPHSWRWWTVRIGGLPKRTLLADDLLVAAE
jgi:hypothetical protein